MPYYPVFLSVVGRPCLVVGGGEVATRKVAGLLEAGARVTVVSPRLTATLATQAADGTIQHRPRNYETRDLRDCFLVYAATNDETVHERIAAEAAAEGTLLNVVDRPRLCTFIVPAVLRRGELSIAVSTGGGSPALAGRVRDAIDVALGDEYEQALTLLSRLRHRLRETAMSPDERQRLFTGLVGSELLEHLRRGDDAAVDRVLAQFAGNETTLASLGVVLKEDTQGANEPTRGA